MHLFFDVDGVLLNFQRSFVAFLNREFGLALPPEFETSRWEFDDVLTPEQAQEAWSRYVASEDAGRMAPLVEPARFNALVQEHPVHLLTNFPRLHMAKREANLHALGFNYRALHHCGLHDQDGLPLRTKAEVIRHIRPDDTPALFVDDHPENCLDVLANCASVEVWVMTCRFNRDFRHPQITRTDDWGSLIDRLRQ